MTPLHSPSSRADVKSATPSPDVSGEEVVIPERRESPVTPAAEEIPAAEAFGTGLRARLGADNTICW
jgi:hypothetical protein